MKLNYIFLEFFCQIFILSVFSETDNGPEGVGDGSGWFNITHVSMESRGWYKCTTVHEFGHFASNSVLLNVLGE